MRILGLYPEHFGKFQNQQVVFEDGLNVIEAANEAGKTTLFTFVHGMLFGIEKKRGTPGKQDVYTKYQPWETPGAYSGTMDLEIEGKRYRISRVFYQNERSCTLTDLESGRILSTDWDVMPFLMPEVSEAGFDNTVTVPQKGGEQEDALSVELQNYIANMSMTKDREVNVAGAKSLLLEDIKKLETKKLPIKLAELTELIKQVEMEQLELDRKAESRAAFREQLAARQEELLTVKEELAKADDQGLRSKFEEYEAYASSRIAYMEKKRNLENLKKELETASIAEEISDCEQQLLERKEAQKRFDELDQEHKANVTTLSKLAEEAKSAENKSLLPWFLGIAAGVVAAIAGIWISEVLCAVGGVTALGICLMMVWTIRSRKLKTKQRNDNQLNAQNRYSEEILPLSQALSKMEPEAELTERIQKLREGEAVRKSRLEGLHENEEEIGRLAAELDCQKEGLLGYFRNFEPIAELTEANVREINGHQMAKSIQLEERRNAVEEDVRELTTQIDKLTGQLEDSTAESRLLEYRYRQEQMELQRQKDETEQKAMKLALDTIQELSEEIHDSYGQKLNEKASAVAEKVTAGKYTKVKLDEKLRIKTESGRKFLPITGFSKGTMEQLYFAMRLAVGETMYANRDLPLLLDDSFAYYDENRLRAALDYLGESKRQVLLFTCQEREKNYLRESKIAFHEVVIG